MKAWLKGGIIGAILSLISFVTFMSFGNNVNWVLFNQYNPLVTIPMRLFIPPRLFGRFLMSSTSYYRTIIITSTLIFWFIIGSIIGFIIGKIKCQEPCVKTHGVFGS